MAELNPNRKMESAELIPSPLIAGVPKKLPDITKEYCEKVAKDMEADGVMILVWRKHDFSCNNKKCDGYHIVGNDFGIQHKDDRFAIQTITEVYGLNDCE